MKIKTFTTRLDTIFSVSFLAVSPEHEGLAELIKEGQRQEVEKYLESVKNKSERDRQIGKDKTGVWTGSIAKNPQTGELVPVFVADYVLSGYGSGAVMGVGGHDERDAEFIEAINKQIQQKAKVPKILMATTNLDKINRLRLLTQGLNIQILSLVEAGLNQVPEPVEDGADEIENAQIKAKYYWEKLITKMPVLAQDDGVYTPGITPEYQAGKDVKATVLEYMGANDQNAVHEYWKMIAAKFDKPEVIYSWNFAYFDGESLDTCTCEIKGTLTDIPSKINTTSIGSPISPLTLMNVRGESKYFSEFNEADYMILADNECKEIVRMLSNNLKIQSGLQPLVTKQNVAIFINDLPDLAPDQIQSLERRNTVHVILKHPAEDKFLCLNWSFGYQSFLIGGIESREDLGAAAIREIKEETGYQNIRFVRSLESKIHSAYYAPHKKENRYAIITGVYCELEDLEQAQIAQTESDTQSPVWVPKSEIASYLQDKADYILWQEFLEGKARFFGGKGILEGSGEYSGQTSAAAIEAIGQKLSAKGEATEQINYKLRDWVFSRQRYWGEPFPFEYIETGKE